MRILFWLFLINPFLASHLSPNVHLLLACSSTLFWTYFITCFSPARGIPTLAFSFIFCMDWNLWLFGLSSLNWNLESHQPADTGCSLDCPRRLSLDFIPVASGSSSRPRQGVWKHPDQPYLYAMIVLDSSKIVLLAELGDYVSFPMKTQKAAPTSEHTVCHLYNIVIATGGTSSFSVSAIELPKLFLLLA